MENLEAKKPPNHSKFNININYDFYYETDGKQVKTFKNELTARNKFTTALRNITITVQLGKSTADCFL